MTPTPFIPTAGLEATARYMKTHRGYVVVAWGDSGWPDGFFLAGARTFD